ncbi:hypothetical protein PCASD_15622 [Puccinia coronata f. sp. avenae]|uniref:Uncharacterized protein n=1 Tax=Puccinia coronata f. sp. avenae TaxID=200324 RepID=A0A2N5SYU3_9BASI|nr:hypothetical protein PCASD_15622 [Puccinia coronata f. sp. avenae]
MRRHHHLHSNPNTIQPPTADHELSLQPAHSQSDSHSHHSLHSHPQIRASVSRLLAGVRDSLRTRPILKELRSKRRLRTLVLQNSLLQLLSIASLVGLESHKHGRESSSWSTLDILFNTCWLFPIAVMSLSLNGSIVDVSLNLGSHGTRTAVFPNWGATSPADVRAFLAAKFRTDSHRVLVLLNYILMAKALLYMPVCGAVSSFAFCALANSFYCFDPVWNRDGYIFPERLTLLETQWDYHLGFGLGVTVLTSVYPHHTMLNLSLFTLVFPFLVILSSTHTTTPRTGNTQEDERVERTKLSSYGPPQLPVFFIARILHSLFLGPDHRHLAATAYSHLQSVRPSNTTATPHDHVHIEDGDDHVIH